MPNGKAQTSLSGARDNTAMSGTGPEGDGIMVHDAAGRFRTQCGAVFCLHGTQDS